MKMLIKNGLLSWMLIILFLGVSCKAQTGDNGKNTISVGEIMKLIPENKMFTGTLDIDNYYIIEKFLQYKNGVKIPIEDMVVRVYRMSVTITPEVEGGAYCEMKFVIQMPKEEFDKLLQEFKGRHFLTGFCEKNIYKNTLTEMMNDKKFGVKVTVSSYDYAALMSGKDTGASGVKVYKNKSFFKMPETEYVEWTEIKKLPGGSYREILASYETASGKKMPMYLREEWTYGYTLNDYIDGLSWK